MPRGFRSHGSLSPGGQRQGRASRDPGSPRSELDVAYRAPTSSIERTLRGIWLEVLRLDDVGVDDSFLDLGGDSLQAAQVASRVRTRLAADISMIDLLSAGTIAAMAKLLTRS